MKKTILAVSVAMLLSACASTSKNQPTAAVESPEEVVVNAVEQKKVTVNPLKDANNILSQRIVYFDFDKDIVRPEFAALIQAHVTYLRQNPGRTIRLEGHADDRGSREYNIALGQRRDVSVAKIMTILGVNGSRIESISLGEEKPQVNGQNEASWAKNRRVEIVYDGE